MRERISPCWPRLTASGLMIAKVRSMATKRFLQVDCEKFASKMPALQKSRAEARQLQNLFQGGGDGGAEVRGSFYRVNACGGHGGVLVLGGAHAAADDGAGVAHTASRGRGLSGDETDDRFFHVGFNPFRGGFFGVAADFADQDDGVRVRVVVEKAHGVKERGADDGIATNADAGRLADAETGQLIDGFVGERATAADDADIALLVDAARHDSDFAFAGGDDARAIGADEARLVEVHGGSSANHVDNGNAFGNANDERNFGIGSFEDSIGSVRRRHKDHGCVGGSSLHRFADRVKDWAFEMLRATFSGGHSADDVGAVLNHLLSVESAFAACNTLDDQARFFVNQDAHRAPPARATTFCAPSFMPSAMVKLSALSRSIFWPISTLVPSMRTTTGTFSRKSFAAATTPVASTSQRKMPPNMLMKTARTLGSLIKMRNAFLTCSEEAPPPTSRKFAGDPPAYLMMSMVAMANPAPLTMQATLPSSLM